MNNRTRLGRLRKLADLLEAITDKKHFDINTWADHAGSGVPHLNSDGSFGCGTSACALGYAALHPAFRRSGLRIKHNEPDALFRFVPEFEGKTGIWAGEAFFGIEDREAQHLFAVHDYPERNDGAANATPKQVAKRVRALIRQYERA